MLFEPPPGFPIYEENLLVTLARTDIHTLALVLQSNLLTHDVFFRARLLRLIVLTVQRNHANDEPNAQHHHHERVNLEAGALVGVQLEHGRAAAAGTSGASARGARIGDFVGAVGGGAAADGGRWASGGFRRGGAGACAAGGDG